MHVAVFGEYTYRVVPANLSQEPAYVDKVGFWKICLKYNFAYVPGYLAEILDNMIKNGF